MSAPGAPRPSRFKGQDLVAEGVAEGPELGRLLGQIEAWWLAEGREPGREACLTHLRQLRAL